MSKEKVRNMLLILAWNGYIQVTFSGEHLEQYKIVYLQKYVDWLKSQGRDDLLQDMEL